MDELKKITEMLEQGVSEIFNSDNFKAYLKFTAKFYNYSLNNQILIWFQNPEASHVAGFQTWKKKFNRSVKKGEKGLRILAPCPHKMDKIVKLEDGTEEVREIRWTTFRPVSVFDISQTDGEAVPTFEVNELSGCFDGFDDLFEKLVKVAPVPVRFENITDGSKGYYSRAGEIVINEGMSEAQTLKTAVHEIAHSMLHSDDGAERDAGRSTREVQAESVAYTVCSFLGLDTSDYSFGYVAGWSADKELKELQENMEVIRKTANEIIEKLRAA